MRTISASVSRPLCRDNGGSSPDDTEPKGTVLKGPGRRCRQHHKCQHGRRHRDRDDDEGRPEAGGRGGSVLREGSARRRGSGGRSLRRPRSRSQDTVAIHTSPYTTAARVDGTSDSRADSGDGRKTFARGSGSSRKNGGGSSSSSGSSSGSSGSISGSSGARSSRPAFPHSVRNAFLLVVASVLAAPSLNPTVLEARSPSLREPLATTGNIRSGEAPSGPLLARKTWMTFGLGVAAAPCATADVAQQVVVTPEGSVSSGGSSGGNRSQAVDLLSVFGCEGGEFDVTWSGVVSVPGTIYIGRGTTVRIVGEAVGGDATTVTNSTSSGSSSSGLLESGNGGGSSTSTSAVTSGDAGDEEEDDSDDGGEEDDDGMSDDARQAVADWLSSRVAPLPYSLTSAAVRTSPVTSNTTEAAAATTTSNTTASSADGGSAEEGTGAGSEASSTTGPIFFVDGGSLHLENLAVRDGSTSNSSESFTYTDTSNYTFNVATGEGTDDESGNVTQIVVSGGGVHAVDANVTVTGCEFEDNFAELWGGGIFANRSSLVVRGSAFRRCRAGEKPEAGDEGVEGAGGGVGVEYTNVLIDGCLFDDGYAGKKGGGMHQGVGQITVTDSLFLNNTAGSGNVEDEDEIGEGGALSLTVCTESFDGLSACGANDTVFAENGVARKGGAVVIGSGKAPSHVELHRCTVLDSTTGWKEIEDDPQGEGGAFSVAQTTTLVLADCLLANNFAGKKGGVITVSSGDDWEESPGGVVVLRNSSFTDNRAHLDNAGVVNLGEFSSLTVEGDGNVFARNECGQSGAVIGATVDTSVVVEGGLFLDNVAEEGGGVIWIKGELTISGGNFSNNEASDGGGVILASEFGDVTIAGGVFLKNEAVDGGVVNVGESAALVVEGGVFSENYAGNGGGVFAAEEGGHIDITGGDFTENSADFGGFLYKEGAGNASCSGSSVVSNHSGVDGGAIYAVEGASLEWGCDLSNNMALAGPAIYARDGADVVLRGVQICDNFVARGSAVFIVSSNLTTFEVVFNDTTGSDDLSAVQADEESTFKAEATTFVGFAGEAVVYSEGPLYLDECDFSGSSASVLVWADGSTATVVRNTVLGDTNYFDLASTASGANQVPTAESLMNIDLTCDSGMPLYPAPPCSPGSVCIDGDLGVYCECYVRESTLEETCVSGDPGLLSLTAISTPGDTFYPDMLLGDLLLTLDVDVAAGGVPMTSHGSGTGSSGNKGVSGVSTPSGASSSGGSSMGGTAVGTEGGVVWNVSALPVMLSSSVAAAEDLMTWTVFPSTGLLLPGHNVTLRVVTLPGEGFDGEATVTFEADGIAPPTTGDSDDDGNEDQQNGGIAAHAVGQGYGGGGGSSSSGNNNDDNAIALQTTSSSASSPTGGSADENEEEEDDDDAGGGSVVSFDVSFYHCGAGNVWDSDAFSAVDNGSASGCSSETCCELCSDVAEGDVEGLDCALPGATTRTLPLRAGYWRASLDSMVIRECFNEDACQGGSTVASEQEYCNDGYEGPQCAVCAAGYGRGVADACHLCTASFKGGMYFVVAVIALLMLVVAALLAVYLVGGRVAVSTTMTNTRQSVRMLQRRGSGLLRSDIGASGTSSDRGKLKKFLSGDGDGGGAIGAGGGGSGQTFEGSRRFVASWGLRRSASVGAPRSGSAAGAVGTTPTAAAAGSTGASVASGTTAAAAAAPSDASAAPRPPSAAGEGNEDTFSLLALPGRAPSDGGSGGGGGEGRRGRGQGEGTVDDSRYTVGSSSSSGRAAILPSSAPANRGGAAELLGAGAGGKKDDDDDDDGNPKKKKAAAARVGEALARLPLSKLKIVVVVWQISSAFAEITKVPFPPVYEKFLSIIGIFSFDLGWMISAACLTAGIDFYDKLLMVTIGPVGLLLLLGVTFYLGARPVRKGRILPASDSSRSGTSTRSGGYSASAATGTTAATTPSASSALNSSRRRGVSRSGGDGSVGSGGEERSGERSEAARTRPRPSARRVWRNGPGDQSDPEQNHLWQLFARHTTMTLIILYLVYTQVSTVVFQVFACEEFPEIGKSYLRADFRVECYTPKHEAYQVYAAVMICIYPLGIPAAFCYFLMRQRSRINPPTDKDLQDLRGRRHVVTEKMNQRRTDQAISPTSFLWNAYYPNRYYYEVFECLRRLLLTGLLVFLVPDTPGQVAFGCVFAFLSLLVFELLRPHTDHLDMQLYRTGCLVIFFTNFLALMIKAEVADEDSRGSAVYSVVLIVVNILFFLSIFWNTWAAAKASFSRRHVQDMMLGVDLVNEDQLDKIIGPKKEKKPKKTNQQKLDDALGPARVDGALVDGVIVGEEGESKTIEDLEAPPAWEADPDDPDSPIDISSRLYNRDLGGHSVASTVAIPSNFWRAASQGASIGDSHTFQGRGSSSISALSNKKDTKNAALPAGGGGGGRGGGETDEAGPSSSSLPPYLPAFGGSVGGGASTGTGASHSGHHHHHHHRRSASALSAPAEGENAAATVVPAFGGGGGGDRSAPARPLIAPSLEPRSNPAGGTLPRPSARSPTPCDVRAQASSSSSPPAAGAGAVAERVDAASAADGTE